jgi:transcriptional regulator with XRE-family HTH domain
MAKAGRKSLIDEYLTEDGLLLLEGWARDGLTNEEIAANIGVTSKTLYEWISKKREIGDALKKGKAPVDIKVENQLLKSALGFKVTVKKAIKVKTKKNKPGVGLIEEEHIEMVDEEQYIPPVPAAQFFWLKNRRPDKWREKQDINVNTIDDKTRAEVEAMLNEPDETESD